MEELKVKATTVIGLGWNCRNNDVAMVCKKNQNEFLKTFNVKSFENGILTVSEEHGDYLEHFAELIAGCFISESNFKKALFTQYRNSVKDISKVRCIFMGNMVELESEGITASKIVDAYVSEYGKPRYHIRQGCRRKEVG